MIFSKHWYLINAGTAGTAVADAQFITDKTAASQRRIWGSADYGFPRIHAALGVEALKAGTATAYSGYCKLTGLGGGLDTNWDRWEFPIPFFSLRTTEIDQPEVGYERFNTNMLNMPYPEGCTLADGTVSKVYGNAANTYIAFVLYQLAGPAAPAPRGGKLNFVNYDKGSDVTTVVWETLENAAQNAAGELEKDHMYRLLWASYDAQGIGDSESTLACIRAPGYPDLDFPGAGSLYAPSGSRRILFLDDSIMLKGDAVHEARGHIGTTARPVLHAAWEDFGKVG